jgi:hypothetical protein
VKYKRIIAKKIKENRNLTDKDEIEQAIKLGEFIRNETLALYSLRKYRHLKRAYGSDSKA